MSDGRRAVRDVSRSHQLYTAGGMPARQTLREWISLQSIESHVMTLDAARVRDAPSGERADLIDEKRGPGAECGPHPANHIQQSGITCSSERCMARSPPSGQRVGVRDMGDGEECEDVLRWASVLSILCNTR